MVRGLSLRERRLVEDQKKAAGGGSSHQVAPRKKERVKARASSPVSSRPSASTIKKHGSSKKKTPEAQDKGKGIAGAGPAKKRKLISPDPEKDDEAPEPTRSSEPDPVEWFSRVILSGETVPRSSELRYSSEYEDIVRWNTQMIARVNRLTVRYDEGLRKAEAEVRCSKGELQEAKEVYEASERSLQEHVDSVKDECRLLLENKDAELAEVRRELKALRDKQVSVEETAKNEAWSSVNKFLSERFKYVRERLDGLRGDTTMDFVAFMQAKNNLEFLNEVKDDPTHTVATETKRLTEEMATYAASEDRFDQVLNEIEAALDFLPASPALTVSVGLEETADPQSNAETEQVKTPEVSLRAVEGEPSIPETAVAQQTEEGEASMAAGATQDEVPARGGAEQSGAVREEDSSSSESSSDEEGEV